LCICLAKYIDVDASLQHEPGVQHYALNEVFTRQTRLPPCEAPYESPVFSNVKGVFHAKNNY